MEKGMNGTLWQVAKTGGIRLEGNDSWFNPSAKLKDGLKEDTITEWKARIGEDVLLDIDADGRFDKLSFADEIPNEPKIIMPQKEEEIKENYFTELAKVKCVTTKKMNFTYVSWADAWAELKKRHPEATYEVSEFGDHTLRKPYFMDETGGYVKVTVSLNGDTSESGTYVIRHSIWMPILDSKNQSLKGDKIDSFAVNKTIQRALTKAIALAGLGLYVYQGEDLPSD